MTITDHVGKVKDGLRQNRFTSEAAVSQGILLPALLELGWPVFDTSVVAPEYSLEGRRVDFALCYPADRPVVFLEVKKVGISKGADRQLFEYAFHVGVPMAVLTDGQEWNFYLPGEQGRYHERRAYKLDLLERSIEEVGDRLGRYLGYERVCSGEALKAARSDYKNVTRNREIEASFPKAWAALIEEQDSLLLDLLAEKVENLCGYKPNLDACSQFLEKNLKWRGPVEPPKPGKPPVLPPTLGPYVGTEPTRTRTVEHFSFLFRGKKYEAGSAREVMTKVFQLLGGEDSGFLERFAARRHGKKRRYLSRDRKELYPGRPDLAEQHSVEIAPGWWMGTNYSRRDIQKIINLACEVAGPKFRRAVQANVLTFNQESYKPPVRLDEIAVERKKGEREPHQISKQAKYAFRKPHELSLSTSKRTVKTWKEVLLGLCEIVIEQHPSHLDKFLKLDKYFSRNPSEFHTPVEICPGIFVETNRGADAIMRMCKRVVAQFGYSENELNILLV